ncbi:MAG: HTH domain-containing protein [Thermodesulfobacteriota bacterium]
MRGHILIRQWEILRLLLACPDGIRVEDLAATLKTRKRTIYRDIAALKGARFNVQKFKRDKESFYYVPIGDPVLPQRG